jgi:hypothetical protein
LEPDWDRTGAVKRCRRRRPWRCCALLDEQIDDEVRVRVRVIADCRDLLSAVVGFRAKQVAAVVE